MIKTGTILKEERERKGIALEDVAVTTRINIKTLIAIESGDRDSLPAKSFLRGFVLSYAKHLRLDEKQVLTVFQEEMGTTKPKAIQPDKETEENEDSDENDEVISRPNVEKEVTPLEVKNKPSAPSPTASEITREIGKSNPVFKIAIAIGIILLIAVILFVKGILEDYEEEAKITEPVLAFKETPSATPPETGKTDTPESNPTAIAVNTSTTTTATTTTTTSTVSTTVTVTTLPPTPQVKSIEVIIEALDKVELDYRVDGGSLKSIELDPESVHTIRAEESLNIDFSDGGAASVIYNGKDLGPPGRLGERYKLRLPR